MILGKKHAFVPLLFFLFGTGCSFHSNQLEVIKTIFGEDSGPKPEWVFSWGKVRAEVFAINAAPLILFAGPDGLLVRFNGVFVEKIEGLELNPKGPIDISITKTEVDGAEVFSYSGSTSDFGHLRCDSPNETANDLPLESGSIRVIEITQKCFVDERVLEQSVILNQTRQLMGLQFFIHPGRLPVTIRYGQIKELLMY